MVDLILSSAAVQVTLLWLYHRRASWGFGVNAGMEEDEPLRARNEGDDLDCVKAALRGQRPAPEGMKAFERWLAVIGQHQNSGRPRAPIRTRDLRRFLPLADPRFQSQYPSPPSRWRRLHPRNLVGGLRRVAARLT